MSSSLALTLPEILLSVVAIALMMVAAFAGDRSARLCTWLGVAALAGAILLVPPVSGPSIRS